MSEPTIYETPLSEWSTFPWWPTGVEAHVYAGIAGHEHEIVVNLVGFGHDRPIPSMWFELFVSECPESWKIENRGTRVEVHPSGRLFKGYSGQDVAAVGDALERLGHRVVVRFGP